MTNCIHLFNVAIQREPLKSWWRNNNSTLPQSVTFKIEYEKNMHVTVRNIHIIISLINAYSFAKLHDILTSYESVFQHIKAGYCAIIGRMKEPRKIIQNYLLGHTECVSRISSRAENCVTALFTCREKFYSRKKGFRVMTST